MDHRYAWEPFGDVAADRASLIAQCGPLRAAHLECLKGTRLEASLNAQRLCRRLWAELAGRTVEDFRLEMDKNGRPAASEPPLYLSLSHSGGFAAAAASFCPVGIDLQAIRPISDRVLARCYSDEERAWLSEDREADRTERAIRLWTMKEAYGKMLGVGIFTPPCFHASFEEGQLLPAGADARFLFPTAPEGFLFTVCLKAGN